MKNLIILATFFYSFFAAAQGSIGNGGSDYVAFAYFQQSLNTGKTPDLIPISLLSPHKVSLIKDEVVRMATCNDFYKTYFDAVSEEKGIHDLIKGVTGETLYSFLFIPPNYVLKNETQDFVNHLKSQNLKVLCDPRHFEIGVVRSESYFSFVAMNDPHNLKVIADPYEWNSRLHKASPFCMNKEGDSLSDCLYGVRKAITRHEVRGLVYNSFEAKNSYGFSFMSFFLDQSNK